ncbi:hypothetical protein TS85_00340 [Sphingomonas hengshuiensis]|uniref:Methyltransferase FkbM domain-containing protein n=2 Tax=Sphingomonas hengshuiensis TaxID=1609977 RepID=A0A7U5HVC1_9SPHN|nr:hypothetical protein TS85_00340 [Sphingomonas hengshuiensis]
MRTNFDLQGFSEIRAHEIALTNFDGEVKFSDLEALSGVNAIVESDNVGGEIPTVTVPAAKIDSIFQMNGQRIAIKLDVEGHEVQVLEGARQLLEANDCVLQVEILTKQNDLECTDFLAGRGYERALHIYNDHYFIRKGNEALRETMRDEAFVAFDSLMHMYLDLSRVSGKVSSDVKKFLTRHPEHAQHFPTRKMPERPILK